MEKFDLCVIGAGPVGYAAAMRAIDFGKKVILIEKNRLGGAGIYDGALASKTLWELSEKVKTTREVLVENNKQNSFDISFKETCKTVNQAIFERKFQLTCHLRLLQKQYTKSQIVYEKGFASFVSEYEVKITRENGEKIIWAENILIATGSRPKTLPGIQVDEKIVLTSNGIHHLEDFPKSLVIVGAGVIGCEYATIFSNFGKTKVYLIDRASRILPFEDEDLANLVASNLEKNGVTIHHEAKLERLEIVDGEVEYEISYPDGKRETIRVEKALLSIGRVPNIEGLNLENSGVKTTSNGYIYEEDTQTNVPHIWAAGDVKGKIMLVNVGEREARHAVVRMFGGNIPPIVYDNISTIMFLHPEVAAVGLNEQQAREKGIPYKLAKVDYSCIARAIAMRKTNGFFKILVTNDDEMKVLGMRAVGEHASSAIQAIALLI